MNVGIDVVNIKNLVITFEIKRHGILIEHTKPWLIEIYGMWCIK
jgi:hypothetical protein